MKKGKKQVYAGRSVNLKSTVAVSCLVISGAFTLASASKKFSTYYKSQNQTNICSGGKFFEFFYGRI